MKLIVLDLEMNQPSQKIIQIGAVELQLSSGKIVPFFSEIVNPGEVPNGFISQLTGISTDDVENARPITQVLIEFWEKIAQIPQPYRLGAWGSDCRKIYRDSKSLNIDVPEFLSAYDLRSLCGIHDLIEGCPTKGLGLAKTANRLGLTFEGHHHNAFDDAWVTAKIVKACLREIQSLTT